MLDDSFITANFHMGKSAQSELFIQYYDEIIQPFYHYLHPKCHCHQTKYPDWNDKLLPQPTKGRMDHSKAKNTSTGIGSQVTGFKFSKYSKSKCINLCNLDKDSASLSF